MTPVVTEGLTKDYGRTRALDGLDLEVRAGEIFGFLGPNGAGKTTTIRLLLDVIRPTAGRALVLGEEPGPAGPALRRRIGYLPGEFTADGRQTVRELLEYLGNLRGGVAGSRIRALAERLELDLDSLFRRLSRGNRQKVGVVQALMHEPELLILDEPTTGLDPLKQHDFLALLREARDAGQTVFMSSHVLSEVQHVADRVGIIREGQLVAVEGVEALRERAMRRVRITFDEPVPVEAFQGLPEVNDLHIDGATLTCRVAGRPDALVKAAARFTVTSLTAEEADLEELFFAYYRSGGESSAA